MAEEYGKYRDSYYSTYQTDDKKYECRTGPFEGFFVSLVEFCKHIKFDKDNDRKDNRTGTQGPPGITFINNTNLYTIQGELQTATSTTVPVTSTASCDEGDIVIEGGYLSNNLADSNLIRFEPSVGGNFDAVYSLTMLGGGKEFAAFTYYFDNFSFRP